MDRIQLGEYAYLQRFSLFGLQRNFFKKQFSLMQLL